MQTNHETNPPLREQLKAGLLTAMKARQGNVVRALRSILSEIDNAEAVELNASMIPVVGKSNDVPRRVLTEEQIQTILQTEYDDIRASLLEYKSLGKHDDAAQLQMDLDVLAGYLKVPGQ